MTDSKKNTLRKNTKSNTASQIVTNKVSEKTKSKNRKTNSLSDGRGKSVFGAFLVFLGIFLLFAFGSYMFLYFNWQDDDIFSALSYEQILFGKDIVVHNWAGRLGAVASLFFIKKGFGISSFLFVLIFFVLGIKLITKIQILPIKKTIINSLFAILWFSVSFGLIFSNTQFAILGGIVGSQIAAWLVSLLGQLGAFILLVFLLLTVLILSFNLKLERLKKPIVSNLGTDYDIVTNCENEIKQNIKRNFNEDIYNTEEFAVDDEDMKINEKNIEIPLELTQKLQDNNVEPKNNNEIEFVIEKAGDRNSSDNQLAGEEKREDTFSDNQTNKQSFGIDTPYDPKLELPDYKLPPLELLDIHGNTEVIINTAEIEANKNRIVSTLQNYNIEIVKILATVGPTITLYEIVPAPGIRISKIKNLEDDIALSLAAIGIRIIAPIPGKGTIGIEVPNQNPEIVSMRSILDTEKFQKSKFELPFGIGKTIQNEPFIANLAKMPHILMAGATGQGKSVGLNSIITSLLYHNHPSELKFVMIDPKKVELTLFSKIERHFLAKLPDSEEAIITDTRKVVKTLLSLNMEMDNRYDLLNDAQVRNIKEYNERFLERKLNPLHGHRFLPYIVVVIDEFADLIMTAGKEIETPLARLAQLARAIGIHLIIATQRPSVNIITGAIKANFPARVAFRVISKIDSRTILDSGGADQLVGRGDMLLSTGNDLIRLQCAFVDTPEIQKITDFIGSQRAFPDAYYLPEVLDEKDEKDMSFNPNERDELFEDAARLIVQTQQGSTSLLQRKLKLGYNRAGRIIDQLEAAGIVGPFEGSKAREVKVANELALEQFLKDIYLNNNNQ